MSDKKIAAALAGQPAPDPGLFGLISEAARSYWQRQGRHANEGLQMAEQGAQSVRGGDLSGLPGMALGPMAYLGSPISALFPERSEVNAATDIPEWSKPFIAGGLETAAIMAPGPKGKGLGRGLASMADEVPIRQYTPEEIARLKASLAASKTPEDEAIAASKTIVPPIEDFLPREAAQAAPSHTIGNRFERFGLPGARKSQVDPAAPPGGPSLSDELAEAQQVLRFWETRGPGSQFSPELKAARERVKALEAQIGQPGASAAAVGAPVTQPQGITAYHGSPHTFDKFDMSKIGTGEGAQAYGHGLYFAESEGVAKSYREALAKPSWQVPPEKIVPELADLGFDPKALELARETLRNLSGDGYQAISALDGMAANTGSKVAKEAASAIRSFNRNATRDGGSMYQVRINAKPDEFLDWDRPLSEQPKAIQDMLGSHPKSARLTGNDVVRGQLTQPTGEAIANRFGRTSDGAAQMKAAGIKGIRYKDAGSRSGEGGTYNYVVFDDSIIDILKRYGIPMTVGVGGGVVVTGANMPPDLAAQMGPQA